MTVTAELKELRGRIADAVDTLYNDLWWSFDIGRDALTAADRDALAKIKVTLSEIAERAYQVEHSLGAA